MKTCNTILGRFTAVLALGAILCLPASSPAVTTTLNINSGLSTITLSGGVFGFTYSEQVSGSLSASWGGTITGDLTGGTWSFTGGGSLITAALHPAGPFSTSPAPYPPGGDNYGATAGGFLFPYGNAVVMGAYRSLTLDITAGTAVSGAAPSGGVLAFTGGHLDWGAATDAGPAVGTGTMAGKFGANTTLGLVSWDGNTLSLPVKFLTTGANGLNETWTGTLVATVPEPSIIALGALGLAGFFVVRNRSRRGI